MTDFFTSLRTALSTIGQAVIVNAISNGTADTVLFTDAEEPNGRYVVGLHGFTAKRFGTSLTQVIALTDALHVYASTWGIADGFGAWIDGDTIHLDAVRLTSDIRRAARWATDHGQLAFYDRVTGESLTVDDDTGEIIPYV